MAVYNYLDKTRFQKHTFPQAVYQIGYMGRLAYGTNEFKLF